MATILARLMPKHENMQSYVSIFRINNKVSAWLLVVLLILSGFAALTATAGAEYTITNPSRSEHDVGVEQIWDVDQLFYGIDHLPGKIVHLNISIKNFGAVDIQIPFKITLNITDDGIPQYCYKSTKEFPTCIGQPVMKAQTAYTVPWNWTAPRPEEMPQGSVNDFSTDDVTFNAEVSTQLNVDINPDNDGKSIKIIIKKPSYKVKLKAGWWVLNGSVWDWTGQNRYLVDIVLGQTNQFDIMFTLENLGDPAYINYQVIPPKGWVAIPPLREHWNSGTNSSRLGKYLTVTVFPSMNLENLPFGKNLKLRLKAYCDDYPECYDILEFQIQVKFIPNPKLVILNQLDNETGIYIKPPTGTFKIAVYNNGNDNDYFEISATVGNTNRNSNSNPNSRMDQENNINTNNNTKSSTSTDMDTDMDLDLETETDGNMDLGAPPENSQNTNWRVQVVGKNVSGLLNPGEHQNFSISVEVPSSARAGTPCSILISARSKKAPEHSNAKQSILCYIFAGLLRNVKFLDEDLGSISMYPSTEITRTVQIKNTGNDYDNTIKLEVTNCPNDWVVNLDLSDIPINGLPKNSTGKVEINIEAPKKVNEGKYLINLTAYSAGQPKDELKLQINVLKVYNISISSKKPICTGNVDDTISLNATVKNNGNTEDTIQLDYNYQTEGMVERKDEHGYEYTPGAGTVWEVKVIPSIIDLGPYEQQNVTLIIKIPTNALADTDFSTSARDGYLISIDGQSLNDPTKVSERVFEVVINPYYNFTLNKKTDIIYFIKQHKKASVDSSFTISNLGNDIDIYNIEYQSDFNWLHIPNAQRRVLPGATIESFFNFDEPWDKEAGEYKFKINCISNAKTDLVRTLELVVVVKVFDVSVSDIYIGDEPLPGAEIKEGDTVLLRVKLENLGDINYTVETFGDELIIKFSEGSGYIGEANITYLPSPDNSSRYIAWVSVPWKVNKARDYYLEVELDPNAKLPDSNRDNNRINGSMKIEPQKRQLFGENGFNLLIIIISVIIFISIVFGSIIIRRKLHLKRIELERYADEDIELFEDRKAERERLRTELNQELEINNTLSNGVLPSNDVKEETLKISRAKFLSKKLTFEFMKPIKIMRPVKKVKPVPKTKPIEIDENINDEKKMGN